MKIIKTKHNLLKATALAAFAALTLVCSGRVTHAQVINISKVTLGTEYVNGEAKGGYGGSIFKPQDRTIYCVVGLTNPAPDAQFKFVWSFYDAAERKLVQIFEQELTGQNSNKVAGKFSSPRDFPIGQYQAEIFINGRLKKKLTYSIRREE